MSLPESKKYDSSIKKQLIDDKCLLIIGGSNSRQGLSAEILSENICSTLNLSINNEMEHFSIYNNWLSANSTDKEFKYILYSPIILWSDKSISEFPNQLIDVPKISIFSQFKSIFDSKSIFNSYGDLENYYCQSEFIPFSLNKSEFLKNNIIVAQEIKIRVLQIENTFNTKNVYLRVPPVYVNSESDYKVYTKLMNDRIEILKGLGVKLIGKTIISFDKNLFCDASHSNASGREVFSKEIKLQ
jgi:hypothetical protein